MDSDLLVDGYNVIKNNPMFRSLEIKNPAEARRLLVQQLKSRYRHTTYQVVVIFDGNDTREQVSHDDHVRIIFSRQGETADSVIVRLMTEARSLGRKVRMYSDDEEIRYNVAEQGGSVHTTYQLTAYLNAPPRDVAQRSYHRQAMRRAYGIDPSYKPDDDLEPPRPSGKKKRKSSRYHK